MLTSRLLIAKGTLRQKRRNWQIERTQKPTSRLRNPATLESFASPQLFSCVRTRNSFKCCAQGLEITEHSGFDSFSGGCSLRRLPACPVSTNAHVALRLGRKTHFLSNLVGDALQLSSADYIAWTELAHPGSLREGFIANPSPRALPLVDTLSNSNLSSIRSLFAAR